MSSGSFLSSPNGWGRIRKTHNFMSKDRFIERGIDARLSAARLAEAVSQAETEIIRDATIQRFEFTFEAVWKALKLYLERQ